MVYSLGRREVVVDAMVAVEGQQVGLRGGGLQGQKAREGHASRPWLRPAGASSSSPLTTFRDQSRATTGTPVAPPTPLPSPSPCPSPPGPARALYSLSRDSTIIRSLCCSITIYKHFNVKSKALQTIAWFQELSHNELTPISFIRVIDLGNDSSDLLLEKLL